MAFFIDSKPCGAVGERSSVDLVRHVGQTSMYGFSKAPILKVISRILVATSWICAALLTRPWS